MTGLAAGSWSRKSVSASGLINAAYALRRKTFTSSG